VVLGLQLQNLLLLQSDFFVRLVIAEQAGKAWRRENESAQACC
jgi:hypothetical protein